MQQKPQQSATEPKQANPNKLRRPWRKRPLLLRDDDRYQLLFGPYEPPLVKRGFLVDAVRGKVPFGTFSNALIPWPKAKKRGKGGSGGFVLCGDLLRALAQESGPAISHYWGVSRATVTNWRRALNLTDPTHLLRTPGAERLVKLGVELARLPESRQKIADAARGRVMTRRHKSKLLGSMRQGWRERFVARQTAYRETGRFPKATQSDPWIPEEDELLRQLSKAELVQVLGRTPKAIVARRLNLGIRTHRKWIAKPWRKSELRRLGTAADADIAQSLDRSVTSVTHQRRKLGIPPASSGHFWTPEEEALIGKLSDAAAARQLGRSLPSVQHHRRKLGMVFFRQAPRRPWSPAEDALLGTEPDAVIAKRLGRTKKSVAARRVQKGIPVKLGKHYWTPEELAILGTMSDREAAQKLNRTVSAVSNQRNKSGIQAGRNRRWTPAEKALLGTRPDAELAAKLGRPTTSVAAHRTMLRIPAFKENQ
jgi:hypothetical protein